MMRWLAWVRFLYNRSNDCLRADKRDDAVAGMGSTALLFGQKTDLVLLGFTTAQVWKYAHVHASVFMLGARKSLKTQLDVATQGWLGLIT
eukprot:scaffold240745_cov22-Tisochrysis_lutea.AAC.2